MLERYKLHKSAQDLMDYLENEGKLDRDKVMNLVHALNAAYTSWADMVDTAEVWMLD